MNTRFVPAKVHGVLDFVTSGIFFTGPEIFFVKDAPASSAPARIMGPVVVAYSIFTDYGPTKGATLGHYRVLSMKTHLTFDALLGIGVLAAPWVFGSWRKGWNYWAPQALLGAGEVFFAFTTKTND